MSNIEHCRKLWKTLIPEFFICMGLCNRVGEKPFRYSRAGRPSASADIVPLDDRVHKKGGNNVPSCLFQALLQIRLPRGMYER